MPHNDPILFEVRGIKVIIGGGVGHFKTPSTIQRYVVHKNEEQIVNRFALKNFKDNSRMKRNEV